MKLEKINMHIVTNKVDEVTKFYEQGLELPIKIKEKEIGLLESVNLSVMITDEAEEKLDSPTNVGLSFEFANQQELEIKYMQLIALGASAQIPPMKLGEGVFGASVLDPVGNLIELIKL